MGAGFARVRHRRRGTVRRPAVAAVVCLAPPSPVRRQRRPRSNKGDAFNVVAVGHNDLGGRGFNADVCGIKVHGGSRSDSPLFRSLIV